MASGMQWADLCSVYTRGVLQQFADQGALPQYGAVEALVLLSPEAQDRVVHRMAQGGVQPDPTLFQQETMGIAAETGEWPADTRPLDPEVLAAVGRVYGSLQLPAAAWQTCAQPMARFLASLHPQTAVQAMRRLGDFHSTPRDPVRLLEGIVRKLPGTPRDPPPVGHQPPPHAAPPPAARAPPPQFAPPPKRQRAGPGGGLPPAIDALLGQLSQSGILVEPVGHDAVSLLRDLPEGVAQESLRRALGYNGTIRKLVPFLQKLIEKIPQHLAHGAVPAAPLALGVGPGMAMALPRVVATPTQAQAVVVQTTSSQLLAQLEASGLLEGPPDERTYQFLANTPEEFSVECLRRALGYTQGRIRKLGGFLERILEKIPGAPRGAPGMPTHDPTAAAWAGMPAHEAAAAAAPALHRPAALRPLPARRQPAAPEATQHPPASPEEGEAAVYSRGQGVDLLLAAARAVGDGGGGAVAALRARADPAVHVAVEYAAGGAMLGERIYLAADGSVLRRTQDQQQPAAAAAGSADLLLAALEWLRADVYCDFAAHEGMLSPNVEMSGAKGAAEVMAFKRKFLTATPAYDVPAVLSVDVDNNVVVAEFECLLPGKEGRGVEFIQFDENLRVRRVVAARHDELWRAGA